MVSSYSGSRYGSGGATLFPSDGGDMHGIENEGGTQLTEECRVKHWETLRKQKKKRLLYLFFGMSRNRQVYCRQRKSDLDCGVVLSCSFCCFVVDGGLQRRIVVVIAIRKKKIYIQRK